MINCPTCEFADFGEDKCKRLLTRLPHICPYAKERKPRNHFERIKSMSMEELAAVIAWPYIASPPWCAEHNTCPYISEDPTPCDKCALEWLKEEI